MKKILVIIQRSNGDVFLSNPLIDRLHQHYHDVKIDLLINDDTLSIAKTLKHINDIITFSYQSKKHNRWGQEKTLLKRIYKKYDLSINLTSSDRSVMYAIFSSSYAISAIEADGKKSWWKKWLLKKYYLFDADVAIVQNNIQPLKLLNIEYDNIQIESHYSAGAKQSIEQKLDFLNKKFIIFHPSAQYEYKIYPQHLRDKLLCLLNGLNIPIIITGSSNKIDKKIKNQLPKLHNIYDFIGKTSLDEWIALSEMSSAYIGMDTLNMHIATAQGKPIFAIFGPTILSTWSPWSNELQLNNGGRKYGNVHIFQANMKCVACGLAGCDDNHGKSECLDKISPNSVFNEVKNWLTK